MYNIICIIYIYLQCSREHYISACYMCKLYTRAYEVVILLTTTSVSPLSLSRDATYLSPRDVLYTRVH